MRMSVTPMFAHHPISGLAHSVPSINILIKEERERKGISHSAKVLVLLGGLSIIHDEQQLELL